MACLEHECNGCGALFFNNRTNEPCPKCGGHDYSTVFDEDPRDFYDDDRGGDDPRELEDV